MNAFLAALLAASPAAPVPKTGAGAPIAPDGVARFEGFVSVWRRSGGDLPRPVVANLAVDAPLRLPAAPGQATTETRRLSADVGASKPLDVTLRFFAVCPHGSASGSPCPGLYYQVQSELSGAAQGFCSVSLNGGDALPFPILQCAGKEPSGPWLGVVLHRVRL